MQKILKEMKKQKRMNKMMKNKIKPKMENKMLRKLKKTKKLEIYLKIDKTLYNLVKVKNFYNHLLLKV